MRLLLLAALVAVGGCGHTAKDVTASASKAAEESAPPKDVEAAAKDMDSCPSRTTEVDPASCVDLPEGYGYSPEHAMEWGFPAATAGLLYYGRLLCPDGNPAAAQRTGSFLPNLEVESSSPKNSFGKTMGASMMDRWAVSCGSQRFSLVSDPYRCGSHCVPKPFKLQTAAATAALIRSTTLEKEGDLEGALREAKLAREEDASSFRTHQRVFYLQLETNQDDELLQTAEEGVAALPENNNLHLYRMIALSKLERWGEALEAADFLLARYEPGHADAAWALCGKAKYVRMLGREEEAETLRAQSCSQGFKGCCVEEEPPAP